VVGQVLADHAEAAAPYFTVFHDLVVNRHHQVAGNREANADIATGARQDGGVDADQFAVQIDQRAARVAGVDGGVGLNEVFEAIPEAVATEAADDAGGDGLGQAERVADGNDEVADPQLVRVGYRQFGQVVGVDLYHRHVGRRRAADQLGLEFAVVA